MVVYKPELIFSNEDFIAVNKPSGLLSIPDRLGQEVSLKAILEAQYGKVYTVHRLDKDTSGLILFALNEQAHKTLSALFEGREINKQYVGLVNGRMMHTSGSIDAPIMEHPAQNGTMITHQKGKPSLTDYTLLEQFQQYAWVQFRIHTGRTHQIRVHMKHIGHSITGDTLYGDGKPVYLSQLKKNFKLSKKELEERPLISRLALHAYSISFDYQDKGLQLIAPVPKDLQATLKQMRKLQNK
jgi:23S rRNA pseudouridine955/2504/2580 synthase/23S rRNA pseudouridine1911/1915/1917 synthase